MACTCATVEVRYRVLALFPLLQQVKGVSIKECVVTLQLHPPHGERLRLPSMCKGRQCTLWQ